MKRFGAMLLILLFACSGEQDQPSARKTNPATPKPSTTAPSPAQAAPRWETLSTFSGSGPAETSEFRVFRDAIQWRVRWSCTSGDLRIQSVPPPRSGKDLLEKEACPKDGQAYSIRTGPATLRMETTGEWKAIVDQQLSTPVDEPLPSGATETEVVSQGSFYNLEKSGEGTAKLYSLPGGRKILRLENFKVTNNVDLFVWLSEAPHPNNSAESVSAEKTVLGNLKSTLGNQNYEIPPEISPNSIRSIVIWCEPVAIAYSAASMAPTPK